MKRFLSLGLITFLAIPFCGQLLAESPQAAAPAMPAQVADRMAWWREARFGMFIHWGLYSILAGEWEGKNRYGEWILNNAQIPLPSYEKLLTRFNPTKFDANAWVEMAKDAGYKYIVITSKHHEGFALFDSKVTNWDVMSTPFKRDILKELADACHKQGMRLGFYYSIMDWHHPDYLPRREWEKRASTDASFPRYITYLRAQLKELLTNYGAIDILWFDGQWEGTWTHEMGLETYAYVRSLQPNIIVNNRVDKGGGAFQLTVDGSFAGDYGTPEQEVPPTGLPGVDWETCMTMNDHWGFSRVDENWKSDTELIRTLVDIASKGGNLLLNVGPTPEGTIPQPSIDRLKVVGQFLQKYGEAIYGTEASPFPTLPWGRCTQKAGPNGETRLFFHVFTWPAERRLVIPALYNKVSRSFLLGEVDRKPLLVTRQGDDTVITLPAKATDPTDTVVVVDVKGRPDVGLPPAIQAGTPIFTDSLDVMINSGRERVELCHTLDGSEPAAISPKVSGPVRLTATTTVKARAFREGKPVSPVAEATFTKVAPRPAAKVSGLLPGLEFAYFEGIFKAATEFDTPIKTGVVANFIQDPRQRDNRFGFRYTGFVVIPRDGVYTLATKSDDGSRLFIDGELIIDNDGAHSVTEKSGVIALAAGPHRIQVDFFEIDGGYELKVYWSGPDQPKQPIGDNDLKCNLR